MGQPLPLLGAHVKVSGGLARRPRPCGARRRVRRAGVRLQPAGLGTGPRQPRAGRALPHRLPDRWDTGVRPRSLPGEPRLPHRSHGDEFGRRRTPLAAAGRRHRGARCRRAHRVDGRGHVARRSAAAGARAPAAPARGVGGRRRRPGPVARADGRTGPVSVRAGGGPGSLSRRARAPSPGRGLPRHLPRVRRRARPGRCRRHDTDARRTGRDGRAGAAAPCARQRLQGRRRLVQGPPREHRQGPYRRGTVRRADAPRGRTRRAADSGDARRGERHGRRSRDADAVALGVTRRRPAGWPRCAGRVARPGSTRRRRRTFRCPRSTG